MKLDELIHRYNILKNSNDITGKLEFANNLSNNDSLELLNFHFSLLLDKADLWFNQVIFDSFSRRKNTEIFLKNIINDKTNIHHIAEAIQLLGHQKSLVSIPYCYEYINHNENDLRYRSIIVLGWVGSESDIDILKNHMYVEQETKLIGYCATAMRQIWYRLPGTKDHILKIYKEALETIKIKEVWPYILICIQDILNIKLGIKEDIASLQYKDDIKDIKEKGLIKLNKYLFKLGN